MQKLTTPDYWTQAQTVLSDADSVMAELIGRYGGEAMHSRGEAFYTLARSIAGQQISVKAADAVWGRLEALGGVTPDAFMNASEEGLRGCGLSRQKILYMKNIAAFFIEHHIGHGYFDAMKDADVVAHLTTIKGIGKWTAEMFLMFHLLRPDVWPIDDIGLQKGILLHYDISADAPPKHMRAEMSELAETWRPYRSVATWYLWRALDPLPVCY